MKPPDSATPDLLALAQAALGELQWSDGPWRKFADACTPEIVVALCAENARLKAEASATEDRIARLSGHASGQIDAAIARAEAAESLAGPPRARETLLQRAVSMLGPCTDEPEFQAVAAQLNAVDILLAAPGPSGALTERAGLGPCVGPANRKRPCGKCGSPPGAPCYYEPGMDVEPSEGEALCNDLRCLHMGSDPGWLGQVTHRAACRIEFLTRARAAQERNVVLCRAVLMEANAICSAITANGGLSLGTARAAKNFVRAYAACEASIAAGATYAAASAAITVRAPADADGEKT